MPIPRSPYSPSTPNSYNAHNQMLNQALDGINAHSHDPNDPTNVGSAGSMLSQFGSADTRYSTVGPGSSGWALLGTMTNKATIPADPSETAVTPTGSITAGHGVGIEIARIRGQLANLTGTTWNAPIGAVVAFNTGGSLRDLNVGSISASSAAIQVPSVGVAPFSITLATGDTSPTMVANLNSQLVAGHTATSVPGTSGTILATNSNGLYGQHYIDADTAESAAYLPSTSTSTMQDNLNNIRYVLQQWTRTVLGSSATWNTGATTTLPLVTGISVGGTALKGSVPITIVGSGLSVATDGTSVQLSNTGLTTIAGGTGIQSTVSGATVTIAATGVNQVTAGPGITITPITTTEFQINATGVQNVLAGTGINVTNTAEVFTINSTGVQSIAGDAGVSVTETSGAVQLTSLGVQTIGVGSGLTVARTGNAVTLSSTAVQSVLGDAGISVSEAGGIVQLTTNAIETITGTSGITATKTGNAVQLSSTAVGLITSGIGVAVTQTGPNSVRLDATGVAPFVDAPTITYPDFFSDTVVFGSVTPSTTDMTIQINSGLTAYINGVRTQAGIYNYGPYTTVTGVINYIWWNGGSILSSFTVTQSSTPPSGTWVLAFTGTPTGTTASTATWALANKTPLLNTQPVVTGTLNATTVSVLNTKVNNLISALASMGLIINATA